MKKDIQIIFLAQVTRAILEDKQQTSYYTYRSYRPKSFWKPEREEGFYSDYGYKGKEPYNLMLVDNEVCIKPRVKYQMSTGEWLTEYFDTYPKAEEFFRVISSNAKVIERQ